MRLLTVFTALVLLASSLPAQNPGEVTTVQGKITEIKKDRRSTTFVVADDGGKTHEVKLTGLVNFEAKGVGDRGFIRPGVYIGAEGTMSNNAIFIKEVSVLIPKKGQRPPQGMVRQAEREAGKSRNSYKILGGIKATQPNPDYPDYTMLALNVRGRIPPINLEKDYQVKVVQTDPAVAAEGMNVELSGVTARGNFKINKVVVTPSEPFKSEEILGPIEGKSAE